LLPISRFARSAGIQPVSAMSKKGLPGRPSKYKSEYDQQALKLCLLGATDKDLADFFEVSEDTINEWKRVHESFSVSVKAGKERADAEVATKLYQRALGYSHPEVDIRVVDHQIVMTDITKHYPPDATSAIFWLKNRQKEKWRDRIVHEGGDPDKPILQNITVSFVPANCQK